MMMMVILLGTSKELPAPRRVVPFRGIPALNGTVECLNKGGTLIGIDALRQTGWDDTASIRS
ncbi:CCAAT-box-binding transcription factor [Anopheles sinensis]|uniref:CCAAT-box-binding transcription factor n=1 Tax=Anopheles sinensis TaxID=74873 RepID=A0A084VR81_ANOSI|nr:CCAAT-box-binding transcription factor [Anopheles sinensis]